MNKKINIIIIFLLISNCTLNKVEKHHGSIYLEQKKDQILINEFNKNDVKKILGPPSTKSYFDNETWVYIENVKTGSKLLKLGKRNLLTNDVLIVEFDRYGVTINKKFLTKEDIKKIKFDKNITKVDYSQKSFIYKALSGLKDKINDPLGTKRIKTKRD